MSLLDRAKADIERISSNTDEWARELTFTAPGGESATVKGIHSKHHLGVDTDGNMVNSKKGHVSVSEKFLIDAGYPVRNDKGEVDLVNHKVEVKDSTGGVKKYFLKSIFPDETVGYITCILEDYEDA